VRDPRLGEAGGQVEQADQPRVLATPVGDEQDRATVRAQAGQDVVAVLPDGLDHHERRFRRQLLEDLDAGALAVDEAVLADGVAAPDGTSRRPRRRS
jgi:hypothetical protein